MNIILQWIDAVWLIIGLLAVSRRQRLWTLAFVLSGMFMTRLLTELMVSIDYPHGILPFFQLHVFYRALMAYSFSYILYLIMAHYSAKADGALFMAATISMFFSAIFLALFVMVL